MKLIITIILILLSIFINAQQNYFSKRYNIGCGESALKIISNGSNIDIIGAAQCFGPGLKSIFIRIDSLGNVLFIKKHGVDSHHYFSGGNGGLNRLPDSSYVFAGSVADTSDPADVLLYKLTKDGDSIWIQHYSETGFQSGWGSKPTRDNGFIICGQTDSIDTLGDVLLMKTDSNGIKQWEKHYGGANTDIALAMDTCLDGGFILIGGTRSFGVGGGSSNQFGNCYVIKTDSLGNEQWSRTFGDIYEEEFWNGITCRDGNFVLAGLYTYFDPYYPTSCCTSICKLYIAKLDTAGNTIFEKTYGRKEDLNWLYSIKELDNCDLIATGWYWDTIVHNIMGVILKTNSMGDSLWMHTYENLHGPYSDSYLYDITPTNDGGFIAVGFVAPVQPDTGQQDIWILRVDSNGCEIANCVINSIGEINYSNASDGFGVFPNPSTGRFYFKNSKYEDIDKIEVYDYTGQCIFMSTGNKEEIDLSSYDTGIYFYKILTKDKTVWQGKMMKISE